MPRSDYRARLDADNARHRAISAASRDIAGGWDAERPTRAERAERTRCRDDLGRFARHYFPSAFRLGWSRDHLAAIERIEAIVRDGGRFALAMPRGSGKTTLLRVGSLWATLYGRRPFTLVVSATEAAASDLLDGIKAELLFNERLRRPFRHATYPVRCLEGNGRRAVGQTFRGERTLIGWHANRVVLPTMPSDAAGEEGMPDLSGAVIHAGGITGHLRGLQHVSASGAVRRPSLVLIDDPQDREAAKSRTQVAERLAVIRGDILAMAGPGEEIAALAAVTVIHPDDVADQLLAEPQWRGIRGKAVISWPTDVERWETYLRLREDAFRRGESPSDAIEFYLTNRREMDEGAEVAWPERISPGDPSAIVSMMNLRRDLGEAAFAAEMMNEPLSAAGESLPTLSPAEISAKADGRQRGVVPSEASILTLGVDCGDAMLHWCLVAWRADDFRGWVVDFGTTPQQRRRRFTNRDADPTLADLVPNAAGSAGRIRGGLDYLAEKVIAHEWPTEDGATVRLDRVLVDSGFESEAVRAWTRHSPHAPILTPAKGFGIGAAGTPMSEFRRKRGERHGPGWILGSAIASRAGRLLKLDTNLWKSAIASRLRLAIGDRGGITLPGSPASVELLGEHLAAEYPIRVSAKGSVRDEWRLTPGAENHWLDAIVLAAAAASMSGAKLDSDVVTTPTTSRSRIRLSDLRKEQAKPHRGTAPFL